MLRKDNFLQTLSQIEQRRENPLSGPFAHFVRVAYIVDIDLDCPIRKVHAGKFDQILKVHWLYKVYRSFSMKILVFYNSTTLSFPLIPLPHLRHGVCP